MSDQDHNPILQRHFVTVRGQFGTRQVHYRRGGQGPAVLLLHQSPQSSREMESIIDAWGSRFTLIAPDAPGYGFSQPLLNSGQPLQAASIDDFAAATLEFADALGLPRFGVYGFHTGASIGVALAQGFPERVAAVAANGLVILTEEELAAILREYLPPFVPCWDGSHLAWLWARLREQTIFFPWHEHRATTRMDFDMPPADRLQQGLQEFLAAGDYYHVAYGAAFSGHAERRLPALTVPVLVTASARDPLAGHLARIEKRSATVQIAPASDAGDAVNRAFAHLGEHAGNVPASHSAPPSAEPTASEYRGAPGQQVRFVRTACRSTNARRTVILLHAVGSSAAALGSLACTLADHAEVLAVDLPGHGASDPARSDDGGAVASTARQLAAALLPLSAANSAAAPAGHSVSILGVGNSAPVAIELARQLRARHHIEASIVLLDPPAWSAADIKAWLQHGLPALTPVWSGGHLLEAWHMVRDSRLFKPWFRRERGGIRHDEPDLDDHRIQLEVRDLLRSCGTWQALLRDALGYPGVSGESPGLRVIRQDEAPGNWAEILAPSSAPNQPAS
ncbi:MAG: alpha/beta hydrolase [Chromatiales bacterium]|nr:MAG: alpha/beta hydrolase [Chromatiales bacterium]